MLVESVHHAGGHHLRRILFTIGRLALDGPLDALPRTDHFENRHDRLYLAYARVMHGDKEAISVLVDGLTEGSVPEKRDAAFLLRHVDARPVARRLAELLDHSDGLVALGAAHALVPRDTEAMYDRIYGALGSSSPTVAAEAQRILTREDDEQVDQYLRTRQKKENRWYVRQRVARILYEHRDREFR
jgi:HEAT repeat protein